MAEFLLCIVKNFAIRIIIMDCTRPSLIHRLRECHETAGQAQTYPVIMSKPRIAVPLRPRGKLRLTTAMLR